MPRRRDFLKLALASGALAAGGGVIARALAAQPGPGATGTIQDVEHVVILMQENRSFDHYFGALGGVRGFDDPNAITLPGGAPVWRQPRPEALGGPVAPFRLNADTTRAETIASLDHSWKGSHDRWKHHDAWIAAKTAMTMGYFTREDLPFYYALADAFTICDAYHCSVFGPTSPNRLHLFTGTSGLTVGATGPLVVENSDVETNETSDRMKDKVLFAGLDWTTYAERLQQAGISWKIYQEYNNFGDNALAYFKPFRGQGAANSLIDKARSWSPGSTADNVETSEGEHLAAELRRDIEQGRLPQVSWIVAPQRLSEHPAASPALGQVMTAKLLAALADHPEVFARTVFILNYDENDGFFDHVPPPVPALGPAAGASTVDLKGEAFGAEPFGLGPRVPMIVVSPWTKGGFVNSELFDHTSVLRFLEARFRVAEPNISPWRRAVCGDLTSIFDFAGRGAAPEGLPDTAPLVARLQASQGRPDPLPPIQPGPPPRQERGQRPARPLPYALSASARAEGDALRLRIENHGRAGACLELRAADGGGEPWFFSVGAGSNLDARIPLGGGAWDLELRGPDGFLRIFRGQAGGAEIDADLAYDPGEDQVRIVLKNPTAEARTVEIGGGGRYDHGPARAVELQPGATAELASSVAASAGWYDLVLTTPASPAFGRRFAGRLQTGRAGLTDPAIGRRA
jgi:phospholipase C